MNKDKDKIDLIEEGFWDHYSNLPSPMWYQYKKQLNDKEDITENNPNLGTPDEKI